MLILTRKIGQIITLGDDIRLTALDVQGCQVRLGFKAPKRQGSTGRKSMIVYKLNRRVLMVA